MRKILTLSLIVVCLLANAQKPVLKGGLSNFINGRLLYPKYSSANCIQGIVNVGFKLNAKGEVTYTTVTKSVIGDLDKEAVRLIKLTSEKWQMPPSYDTTALVVVPVNFVLSNQDCRMVSQRDVNNAITNFYKDEQIEKTIISYYMAKEKGNADIKDEGKIGMLKQTIGVDDEVLADRVDAGLKKIKQGDLAGACEDFNYVKYMGAKIADKYLAKYCK